MTMQIDMLVVSDADYDACLSKLDEAGFRKTRPARDPAPEVLRMLPDPDRVIREINLEFAALDRATTTLEYPEPVKRRGVQLVLMPASYTWLSASPALNPVKSSIPTQSALSDYDVFENIRYPHERVLLESFIHVILAEKKPMEVNEWMETLGSWVGTIHAFLDVENDALDACPDVAVREYFSEKWGRGREAKYGPLDRRITKRLGSGREFAFDMRGCPLAA